MARMHSGAKGKSGSKRPAKHVPVWAPFKEKEVEKLVLKYVKAGKEPSEIGIILRDSYGINSVKALTGKNVTTILAENKLLPELPEDLLNLIRKMVSIKQHLEKNHHDQSGHRGLILTSSKIRRLVKYYQRMKKLPMNWKLDTERLKMYLQ
ncbi:TPA: 30S ribosomal protein S15 [Candidatus Woesearchaeota archaeon]|nr:30S ribosomal protein S15 [Candidatus Woesearchaeota archaeon]